ncbi:MAG: cyclophilin-like fold protein [Desulfomonilia bacterium]
MYRILIVIEREIFKAELVDCETSRNILSLLPVQGKVNLWGEEIYFPIPLEMSLEGDARTDVEIGDLGYWPDGPAFCIFFGPTPASRDSCPKAYSPVTVIGRFLDDPTRLKVIHDGAKILVQKHGE